MHILDRPVWEALRSRQARWAEANATACRMLPEVGPFAAGDIAGLRELIADGRPAVLIGTEPHEPPADWTVAVRHVIPQFVWKLGSPLPAPPRDAGRLTAEDGLEMEALAALTKPGPFGPRTHELGAFYGVRRQGRLLAMAGERMQPPGFVEVSAVCTHPDAIGQGLAGGLMTLVIEGIVARGETPFLHVYGDNHRAIALYQRLGFEERCRLHFTVVKPGQTR